VLSSAPPPELLTAVAAGDASRLRAPGVGKRTAERIIVELREKVGSVVGEDAITISRADDPASQAREALAGLGYSPAEAEELLGGATGETTEELIAHALRMARR
jgi:Holliday junction DNA helicase RuvA